MDRGAFAAAGALAGGGTGGIEFTSSGVDIEADARCRVGFAGGDFIARQLGFTSGLSSPAA